MGRRRSGRFGRMMVEVGVIHRTGRGTEGRIAEKGHDFFVFVPFFSSFFFCTRGQMIEELPVQFSTVISVLNSFLIVRTRMITLPPETSVLYIVFSSSVRPTNSQFGTRQTHSKRIISSENLNIVIRFKLLITSNVFVDMPENQLDHVENCYIHKER